MQTRHARAPQRTRSLLFVPADRTERIAKATACGADAVIVDLEDAVPPDRKGAARDALANWLATAASGTQVLVRINAADTEWHGDDLRVVAAPAVAGLVVPKAERASVMADIAARLPGRRLLPLVETARGCHATRRLAATPGVDRLVFGSIDLQLDLGIDGDGDELLAFRSALVLASRLGGCAAPVDGVSTAIDDAAAVQRDAERARREGFSGKLCIHPKQVAAVHAAFTPAAAELDWARRVLAAARASGGAAVALDGRMVDLPVIRRAEALLALGGGAASG